MGSLKLSDLGWLLVLNLLLFQGPIRNVTGFAYIDEAVSIIAIILFAVSFLSRDKEAEPLSGSNRCMICISLFVCLGLLSNLFSHKAAEIRPILIDVFTCIKFPAICLCVFPILKNRSDLVRIVEWEFKALALTLFFFGIMNLFIQVGDFGIDPRYGLRASFRFIFVHPEDLVFACVGIVLVLARDYRRNKTWLAIVLVVVCLSLRSKGIAFSAVSLLLFATWRHRGQLNISQVALGILVAIAIGWDQYIYYFQNAGFARSELLRVSVLIANRFFPFGSGFATFGSNVTSVISYYSPLYYEYGLNNVQGLMPGQSSFLSDSFWPIIVGQFGWFGLMLYCLAIGSLFICAYKSAMYGGQRLCVVLCCVFLLISSTAESAFFHPNAIYLAFCLALSMADMGFPMGETMPARVRQRQLQASNVRWNEICSVLNQGVSDE